MWSWNLPLCKFHTLVLILSIRALQRNSNSSSLLWAGGLEKYAPIRVCESKVHCKGAPRSLSWLGFEKLISPSHWGWCLLPNPGGGVPKSEGRLPGEEERWPWAAQGAAEISSCDLRGWWRWGACLARCARGEFHDLGSSPALPLSPQQILSKSLPPWASVFTSTQPSFPVLCSLKSHL